MRFLFIMGFTHGLFCGIEDVVTIEGKAIKVKSIIASLQILMLLSVAVVSAGVTRESTSDPDETVEHVFYVKGEEVARQVLDEDGSVIKTAGRIPDDIVKQYYKNGKLEFECKYNNNRTEGIARVYYESGKLSAELSFKNGKLEGVSKEYHENGKLSAEYNYKDNKLDSISRLYYESGNLMSEWNYKDDKHEGISKKYYEHGGIRCLHTYENGQLIRKKTFDKSGKLESDKNYAQEKKSEE